MQPWFAGVKRIGFTCIVRPMWLLASREHLWIFRAALSRSRSGPVCSNIQTCLMMMMMMVMVMVMVMMMMMVMVMMMMVMMM